LLSIIAALGISYIIRQFLVPRPIFDLVVASLEAIFVIPFFGAIFTDLLLHAWRRQRLPYTMSIINIVIPAIIGIGTNLVILFGSPQTMQTTTEILNNVTDITTICVILILGALGLSYWHSIHNHQK
jgi:hypothetical protein